MRKNNTVLFLFFIAGTAQCMKNDMPDTALVIPSLKLSVKPVKSLNGVQKNKKHKKKHKNGVPVVPTFAPVWPYVKSTTVFFYPPDRFSLMSNLDKADFFQGEFLRCYPSETDLAHALEDHFMRAHYREQGEGYRSRGPRG